MSGRQLLLAHVKAVVAPHVIEALRYRQFPMTVGSPLRFTTAHIRLAGATQDVMAKCSGGKRTGHRVAEDKHAPHPSPGSTEGQRPLRQHDRFTVSLSLSP